MADKSYVWVLEGDLYEQKEIIGVFASAEDGMEGQSGKWTQHDEEFWTNDLDWEDARSLRRYELIQPVKVVTDG